MLYILYNTIFIPIVRRKKTKERGTLNLLVKTQEMLTLNNLICIVMTKINGCK